MQASEVNFSASSSSSIFLTLSSAFCSSMSFDLISLCALAYMKVFRSSVYGKNERKPMISYINRPKVCNNNLCSSFASLVFIQLFRKFVINGVIFTKLFSLRKYHFINGGFNVPVKMGQFGLPNLLTVFKFSKN